MILYVFFPLYLCHKFYGNVIVSYANAVKCLERSRKIEPAIYNEARLVEQPIPVIHDESDDEIDSQIDETDFQFDDNRQMEIVPTTSCSASNSLNAQQIDPLAEPEITNQGTDQIDQKPNVAQLGLRIANNNGILDLIEECDDVEILSFEGETFEMTVGAKGLAMPIMTTHDNRIKRENDEISGSEPYYETVSAIQNLNGFLIYDKLFLIQKEKARVYKIGDNLTEFPNALIIKLLSWNKPPRRDDVYYDKRFTRSLLMALVPQDRLASSNVFEEEKRFIQSKPKHI